MWTMRAWCFGSEEFREALLEKLKKPESLACANPARAITKCHDEREARRLLAIGLTQPGIKEDDLRLDLVLDLCPSASMLSLL
jgi:hypothetical protein